VTGVQWDPPGKGDWRGMGDHFPRPLTPEYQRLLAHGMEHGEADFFERYGLPARTLLPAFVHGRVFITAAPLAGPATNRVPPAALMWLAVRMVPAFRRRAAAARRAARERPWREEVDRWYAVDRPAWQERNRALDAVDPAKLGDVDLTAHLLDARTNAFDGYFDHFRLHGADLVPTGLFLSRAEDWGIDLVDAAALLAGSSPASRGEEELPAWRLVTGYDLDERCACELDLPAPVARPPVTVDPALEDKLRSTVPTEEREEWDEVLADARATYGARDDNGLLTAAWPVGLLRRAMLEAGRRLAERRRLARRDDAVELTVDELTAALAGQGGWAETATRRRAERMELAAHVAPASLGPDHDLPMHVLPDGMRRLTRALMMLRDLGITRSGERRPLEGVGVGTGRVVGRACVTLDPAEALDRFEPGDIVVTRGTCPAWNAVLAHAGGVVTEEGGPLSHAAVIARELGIPALIAAAEATSLIADGEDIELDASAGSVRPLG
jgi:rifampicin phosphotransferase